MSNVNPWKIICLFRPAAKCESQLGIKIIDVINVTAQVLLLKISAIKRHVNGTPEFYPDPFNNQINAFVCKINSYIYRIFALLDISGDLC